MNSHFFKAKNPSNLEKSPLILFKIKVDIMHEIPQNIPTYHPY